jgi:hypothetical protein
MNTPREVTRIEQALDTAISDNEVPPRGCLTDVQSPVETLLTDPIGIALRYAIAPLGQRLYDLGGLNLMSEVCHRLGDLDPSNGGRRLSILHHWWNGVGCDRARWWA